MPSYRSWLPPIRAGLAAAALAIGATAVTVTSAGATAVGPAGPASGWRTVPGPTVAATASANLTALAMAGPSLGWTAGFTLANNQNAPFEPLLAAWNGHRWRNIAVRLPAGTGGRIDGLAAASGSDAWAVGTIDVSQKSARPLFLHWNGRQWTRVAGASVPGFGYVSMLGVAIHSATDVWAVGEAQPVGSQNVRPVIEHWNGRGWRLVANPTVPTESVLSGVTVAPDGEAWAAGTTYSKGGRGLVLHWSKHTWTTAATPVTGGSELMEAVTAVSPDNVWAVGTDSADGGAYLPYALHWNGRRWASVAVPHPGEGNESWGFEAVTSIGHGNLVAVGSAGSATVGRALYGTWNGRRWTLGTAPHIDQLNAISPDGKAIWAVGSVTTAPQTFKPVVQVRG